MRSQGFKPRHACPWGRSGQVLACPAQFTSSLVSVELLAEETDIQMQMAQLSQTALHWREDGDPEGQPLVFANSLGTDLRLWDPILPYLPAGLRIIRFDNRGHGLSDRTPGPYTMDALITDAEELLDQLGIKGAVFVGLSIGGMIGQGLCHRRPDLIRAFVLSNSAARMGTPEAWADRIAAISDGGGIGAISDMIVERWFAPAFRTTARFALWRNMLLATPVEGYLGCCHAIAGADLTAQTATLELPTLAIAGAEDGASPPELIEATARLIKGAAFQVIADAGHLPCVEQPEIYANLLTTFLKEHGHV